MKITELQPCNWCSKTSNASNETYVKVFGGLEENKDNQTDIIGLFKAHSRKSNFWNRNNEFLILHIAFFLMLNHYFSHLAPLHLHECVIWPQSLQSLPCQRRRSYIHTLLFSASPQAAKWTASHNQLSSLPLPQHSYNDHPCPLQSERDCPSEPNCSGRSQTKHSASQPGWVQSKATVTLICFHFERAF